MKKKQWEPETVCVGGEVERGVLMLESLITDLRLAPPGIEKFRIIREKDYQRLLKLARKAKRTP